MTRTRGREAATTARHALFEAGKESRRSVKNCTDTVHTTFQDNKSSRYSLGSERVTADFRTRRLRKLSAIRIELSDQWLKKQQDSDFCAKPPTTSGATSWQYALRLRHLSWMRGYTVLPPCQTANFRCWPTYSTTLLPGNSRWLKLAEMGIETVRLPRLPARLETTVRLALAQEEVRHEIDLGLVIHVHA